ncbi:hypothetical protein TSO352_12890 [Azospirillum sp. TSO35-2]|nr:hypothetical protein TSO352_12890 [Azospirillum sp. TSO35-2]
MSRADRIANLIIAAIVMVVAVAAIVATADFPATSLAADVGPARFPILYAGALIVLCGILIVHTLRKPAARPEPARPATGRGAGRINVALGIGATALCLVAISYIGFAIATALYLSGIMGLMGQRGKLLNPLIAVVATAIIYVTFSTGLQVPLPVGSLFE